jgi:RHS repeat-associated protein
MEVKFYANTLREDLNHYTGGALNLPTPNRLDAIMIKNTGQTDSSKFQLDYSYFSSTGTLPIFSIDETDKKRLKLNSIQEFSGDGSLNKPKYEFTYDLTLLPRRLSYGRDHGGYYNGVQNNNSLIDSPFSAVDRIHDRRPIEGFLKAAHLNQIKWPTGGKTEYNFEANNACAGCEVNPGLRIKEIKAYTASAVDIHKTFSYSQGINPYNYNYDVKAYQFAFVGPTGGFGASQKTDDWMDFTVNGNWNNAIMYPDTTADPNDHDAQPYGHPALFDLTSCLMPSFLPAEIPTTYTSSGEFYVSSDLYGELKGLIGQSYQYNQVVERNADGGFTEYHYPTVNVSILNTSYSFPLIGNMDKIYNLINQGKLTYEAQFKPGNIKIKETVYDYISLSSPETQVAYRIQTMLCNSDKASVSKYFLPKSTRSLLQKKTEITYDQSGNNGVEVVTNHIYGTNHEQPITTSMNRSNGDSLVTETKYVKDYVTASSNTGFAARIKDMQADNINAPIETLTFVKKSGETNANMKAISGRITYFDAFASNSHNLKPLEIYTLKVQEAPITVSRSSISSNLFTKDGNYEKRAEFTYNAAGLLATERLTNGATTVYSYTGNGLLNSKTEASGSGIDLPTSFLHNDLFGPTQITEPNGLIKTFEYDKLGRLSIIKDNNGDFLAKNSYEYGATNRVGTYLARLKTTTANDLNSIDYAAINYQYFDGLGREVQKIGFKASPTENDIASGTTTYDLNGRPKLGYLPFPTTLSTGGYQSDIQAKAKTFYGNDDYPYNESYYEASPLNRQNEIVGPGGTWRNPNKSVKMDYESAGSTIPLYKISGTTVSYNSDGKYPANSLFKTTKTDEETHITVEIKDTEGKLIQKQVQGPAGYMTTHYVYNDLNQLKAVIQPEAYPLSANLAETEDKYKGNVFFYKYDNRGRIISKKVPAAGEEYMAYDQWDRLVLSQSPLQRADNNRWSFYKYDALNREIYRGDKEYGGASDPNTLQTNAMASNTVGESRTNNLPFYNENSFPDKTNTFIGQINFYDTYSNDINQPNLDWRTTELNYVPNETPHSKIDNTKGLLTGSYVRNLIDFSYLKAANYYDNKGRLIQSTKTNHLSGNAAEVMSTEYNFAGEPLVQRMIHKKTGETDLSEKTIYKHDHVGRTTQIMHLINGKPQNIATYEYDEIGRQKSKKINAVANAETKKPGVWSDPTVWKGNELPVWNNFVKIGHNVTVPINFTGYGGSLELNSPNLLNMLAGSIINLNGEKNNYPFLQKIDYDYHIRGGLLGINLDNGNTSLNNDGDLFSYKLNYGLDGNISRQEWQHSGTNETRSYDFGYDPASRLTSATYSPSNKFDLSTTYDKNGNIGTLVRKGNGIELDNLTYEYTAGRLTKVTDTKSSTTDAEFVHKGNGTGTFGYATDGSMVTDDNENITGTNYNTYLKQPRSITLGDGRSIEYKYDGSGKLLRTVYSTGETWDYADNLIYKNGVKFSMNTAEGRSNYVGTIWNYEYFYTDHLGNTRASFLVESGQITKKSQIDFDPLGVKHGNGINNPIVNRFEMQGHEKGLTFGLNRVNFGNRSLNPTIGRFDRTDNFGEKYSNVSNYQISMNNPLKYIDINGDSLMYFKDGVYVGTYANGKSETTGFNQNTSKDKNGKEVLGQGQAFSFNDLNSDREKLKSKKMTLDFVSSSDLAEAVNESGIEDQNVLSRGTYASIESNALNERGTGKMDMRGYLARSPLSIINGVGYNNADAGNYLWGFVMGKWVILNLQHGQRQMQMHGGVLKKVMDKLAQILIP